ncbi:polysaccharide deacetylase WbmS family protein [Lichenifustis flavocetrariae]|uniref:Uncharacterized protein n=1 Tax=Lichenifustis flavocetrariae TaxID=2949735 RepID=A0AA41YVV9_9HYPH|nr:hypothetical protein [Lichenifustis flavocetrariae]MCW6509531.1 hypothetical protein [Lichenifustis flavocetrariae]
MQTDPSDGFVLTGDVDWASDDCIESYVEAAAARGIKPTLFVTHRSAVLERLAQAGLVDLGIHPNFLAGTTHGDTIDGILDHVFDLVPDPIALRCHAFFDNSHVAMAVARRGITVDSNLCCHLQGNLQGLRHWNGVLRLPVFFEDDVHWTSGLDWDFQHHATAFASPGLKILNFHPFMWAMNANSAAFYADNKPFITTLSRAQAVERRYQGRGSASFLTDIIEWVERNGRRFVTLSELASATHRRMVGGRVSPQ